MTADPEAVTRALAEHRAGHTRSRDDGQTWTVDCACGQAFTSAHGKQAREMQDAHLASVLASLPDDRLAEAEKDANGPGWFWTRTEWSEWSNELALLIPEEYDDDVAQEAVISRAVADMVKRLAEAEAKVARVEALCDQRETSDRRMQETEPDDWQENRDHYAARYGGPPELSVDVKRIRAALSGGDAT